MVEVRKTKPKIETPFKCYIYESKGTKKYFSQPSPIPYYEGKGKVIGEFVCDEVYFRNCDLHDFDTITLEELSKLSHVTEDNLLKYADRGNLYGWHISNLIIYDKPKELSEFRLYNVRAYYDEKLKLPMPTHEITRPPQSWCYVEEV